MTNIRFYHMERQALEDVLPALLAKALEQGRRVVVHGRGEEDMERLSAILWGHDPGSFLPHGTSRDGFADRQPVWLTASGDNPNGADVLILAHGAEAAGLGSYALCCVMIDGADPEAVGEARNRWKAWREQGHGLTYWKQGARGWEKIEI